MKNIVLSLFVLLFLIQTKIFSDTYGLPIKYPTSISYSDEVNHFTGDYVSKINLINLTGRNNISFSLNMVYNSNVRETHKSPNYESQASNVGLGWDLEIPFIIPIHTVDIYFPDLDGAYYCNGHSSSKLKEYTNNLFDFKRFKYWKVLRTPDTVDDDDSQKWEIIDENGIKYTFAHKCNEVWQFWSSGNLEHSQSLGYMYNLTELKDSFGNSISFTYLDEEEDVYNGQDYLGNYTKSTRIDKITDNTTGRVIEFIYESRSDYWDHMGEWYPETTGDVNVEIFSVHRIKEIKLWDKDPDTYSDENCIKHLKFQYTYKNYEGSTDEHKKLMLSSIEEVNPNDPNSSLPTTKFSYKDLTGWDKNSGALDEIILSSGGTKTITYDEKYCSSTYFYRTQKISTNDGYSTVDKNYSYSDGYFELYSGPFLGYEFVSVNSNSSLEYGEIKYQFRNPGPLSNTYQMGALIATNYYNSNNDKVKETLNTNQWINIRNDCYHHRVTEIETRDYYNNWQNYLATIVEYDSYDTHNGQPAQVTTTNTDGTVKVLETIFAHDKYTGMLNDHMLVQKAQETIYLTSASQSNARSSSVTTWKEWSTQVGGTNAWAPEKSYSWLENDATVSLPTFDGWTSNPSDTEWRLTGKILDKDQYGNVLESQDANGVVTSGKYCFGSTLPVATIVNAEQSTTTLGAECGYIGFESADNTSSTNPDNDYWQLYNDARNNTFSTEAYSGCYSRKVNTASGTLVYGPTRDFQPPTSGQDRNYVISCWVKTAATNGDVYLYAHDKTGTVNQKVNLDDKAEAKGTGDWEYLECRIDLGQTTAEKIRAFIVNNSTSNHVLVDELRFSPVDAQFSSTAYDTLTLAPISTVSNNGYASHTAYDKWHRPFVQLTNQFEPISSSFNFLSRSASATDVFESSDPNYSMAISSNSPGLFDNFSYNSISKYTESNSTSSVNWSVIDGDLKAQGTSTTGFEYFCNQDLTVSDFVLECDIIYDNTADEGGFLIKSSDGAGNSIRVDVNPTRFQFLNASGGSGQVTPGLSRNEWHHICIISIGNRLELWVDGQLETQTTDTTHPSGFCGFVGPYSLGDVYFDNFCLLPDPAISVSYADGLGRTIQTQQRDGDNDIVSKTVYNAIGKVSKQYHPQEIANSDHDFITTVTGNYSELEYEDSPEARLKKKIHSDSDYSTYAYSKENFYYDTGSSAYFFCVTVTDEEGNISKTFTDKFGNEIGGIAADGTTDEIKWAKDYDILGNVVKIKPPNYFDPPSGTASDWQSVMTYNTLGELVKSISPDQGETWYAYDKMGNIKYSQNDLQRNTNIFTAHHYDNLGRITWLGEELDVAWSGFTSPPSIDNSTYGKDADEWKQKYTYDTGDSDGLNFSLGQLTKLIINADGDIAPEHITAYVYDQQGNIVQKQIQLDGGTPLKEKIITHQYDFLGRETELVYPSGNTIVKSYNAFGQLDKIMSVK